MITIRTDKNDNPVEIVEISKNSTLVNIPELSDIIDYADSSNDWITDITYNELLGEGGIIIKELLKSGNNMLVDYGMMLLDKTLDAYNEEIQSEKELPDGAVNLYAYYLENIDLNSGS